MLRNISFEGYIGKVFSQEESEDGKMLKRHISVSVYKPEWIQKTDTSGYKSWYQKVIISGNPNNKTWNSIQERKKVVILNADFIFNKENKLVVMVNISNVFPVDSFAFPTTESITNNDIIVEPAAPITQYNDNIIPKEQEPEVELPEFNNILDELSQNLYDKNPL
jgi:phosphoribosylaminoimidazole carboxylase (NCAIR synthetase)